MAWASLDATIAAAAMKFAGYVADVTLSQVMSGYTLLVDDAAAVVAAAGYSLSSTAIAIAAVTGSSAVAVAQIIAPIAITTTASTAAAASATGVAVAAAFTTGSMTFADKAPIIVGALAGAGVGFSAVDVGTGLKAVVASAGSAANIAVTVSALAAYYSADTVAVVLRDVFGKGTNDIAKALKGSFDPNAVMHALRHGLGIALNDVDVAVAAMKFAGYLAQDTLRELLDVYHELGIVTGASLLSAATYGLDQVAIAVKVVGGFGATSVANAVAVAQIIAPIAITTTASTAAAASATGVAVAAAFTTGSMTFADKAPIIVGALAGAGVGFSAVDVGTGLKAVVASAGSAANIAVTVSALAAYYSADTVAVVLRDVFGKGTNDIAKALKGSFDPNAVMHALRHGLGIALNDVDVAVAAMKFAGYLAQDTLRELLDVYHELGIVTGASLLSAATYGLDQVAIAVKVVGGFGATSVANAVAVAQIIAPIAITTTASTAAAASATGVAVAAAFTTGSMTFADKAPIIVGALAGAGVGFSAVDVGTGLKAVVASAGSAANIAVTVSALAAYYSADTVAVVLRDVFGKGTNDIAKALKGSFDPNAVMHALRHGLGIALNDVDVAVAAMKFAGYLAQDTLRELLDVYHELGIVTGASLLSAATYGLDQVAIAVKVVGRLTASTIANATAVAQVIAPLAIASTSTAAAAATATATALASAYSGGAAVIVPALVAVDFVAIDVVKAAKTVFGTAESAAILVAICAAASLDPVEGAQVLRDAAFSSTSIALAAFNGLGLNPLQTAQVLFDVHYSIPTIAHRLADPLEADPFEAAQFLLEHGGTSTEIATSMLDDFHLGPVATAKILDDLGYGPSTIAKRLKGVFGKDPGEVAEILHDDLDYGVGRIVEGLKGISQDATETVTILKDLGYGINTLVEVLHDDFSRGVASIQSILLGLDYSITDILDAISDVLG